MAKSPNSPTRQIKSEIFMQFLKDNAMSKARFCRENHMALGTLNSVLKGGHCTLKFVVKITRATGYHLEEIFYPYVCEEGAKPPAVKFHVKNKRKRKPLDKA